MVLGHKLTISYHKERLPVGHYDGFFDPAKAHIYISDDFDWDSILLHEIIHAVLHFSGHKTKFKNEEDEEALIIALEYGLKNIVTLKI